ncbi:MAG: hypothetical protein ACTS53_01810 [Candidatus Hodgkinia cicadicola]
MVYATTETSVGDLRKTDVTNWIGLREMNERMVFRKRSGAFREVHEVARASLRRMM